jgi:hypothetical protein
VQTGKNKFRKINDTEKWADVFVVGSFELYGTAEYS